METPEDLLKYVCDRESFVEFVTALANEANVVESVWRGETEDTNQVADRWQNGSISTFLEAALQYVEDRPLDIVNGRPSWKDIATFLYFGKIYE